jgi:hypothetical protein
MIFVSQGAPPASVKPAANFATITAGVIDMGGKFATVVNDTIGKLSPVSMTPAANFPPVLLTSADTSKF